METKIAAKIGCVKLSEHRKKIVRYLSNNLKIPTEISKSAGLSKSEISKTLRALKDARIVVCHNEESYGGRFYGLTDLSKEVLKNI